MSRMKRVNRVVTVQPTVIDQVLLSDGIRPINQECAPDCAEQRVPERAGDISVRMDDPKFNPLVLTCPSSVSSEQLSRELGLVDVTTQKEKRLEEAVLPAKQFQKSLNKAMETNQMVSVAKKETKMTKRVRKTKTMKPDFYARYHHVVPGSVREPSKADLKAVSNCHGRVCDVKCVDCKRVFTINTQDAFQCLRCDECKSKRAKERRSERGKKYLLDHILLKD